MSLNTEPMTSPNKDAMATRKACSLFDECIISPINAPMNGPSKIPIGKKNIPKIAPMIAPVIPILDALCPFAAIAGASTSTNIVSRTKIEKTTSAQIETVLTTIAYKIKPANAKGRPGKIGKIAPKVPTAINKPEIIATVK
jgi:hypothetical protein